MNKYIIFISAVFLSACASMTIIKRDPNASTDAGGMTRELRVDSFFWGITSRQAPSAVEVCGVGGVQRLEMRMSTSDVLLTAVTLGVYVPHRAKYVCVNQSASNNGT